MNSEFRDLRGRWTRDDLLDEGWMSNFLHKWRLTGLPPLDPATLDALKALRALMERIVQSLPSGAPDDDDLVALNFYLPHASSMPRLLWNGANFQLELQPQQRDWNWAMAEIVLSFAHLLVHADIRRLKSCANTHCRWIFYDESKSRTRLYCTSDKCGNLLKVRRFRARHKHEDVP